MTACQTCGGGYGVHDDYAHGTGDYAGDVYGVDPPAPCGTCDGDGLTEQFDHPRPGATCPECDGEGVS